MSQHECSVIGSFRQPGSCVMLCRSLPASCTRETPSGVTNCDRTQPEILSHLMSYRHTADRNLELFSRLHLRWNRNTGLSPVKRRGILLKWLSFAFRRVWLCGSPIRLSCRDFNNALTWEQHGTPCTAHSHDQTRVARHLLFQCMVPAQNIYNSSQYPCCRSANYREHRRLTTLCLGESDIVSRVEWLCYRTSGQGYVDTAFIATQFKMSNPAAIVVADRLIAR